MPAREEENVEEVERLPGLSLSQSLFSPQSSHALALLLIPFLNRA